MYPNCRVWDYSDNLRASIYLWKSDSEFSCLKSLRAWILGEVNIVSCDFYFYPFARISNISNHTCVEVKTQRGKVPLSCDTAIMTLASLLFLWRRQSMKMLVNRYKLVKHCFSTPILRLRGASLFSSFSLGTRKSYDISGVKDSKISNDEMSIATFSCNTTDTHDATSSLVVTRSRNRRALRHPY